MRRHLKVLRDGLAKRQKWIVALLAVSLAALGTKEISERSRGLDAEEILDSVIVIQNIDGRLSGSGAVLRGGRYAITVNHVVEGMIDRGEPIVIRYRDGRTAVAELVKRNSHFDIALLALPYKNAEGLRVISDSEISQGDAVRAIGHPHGITWLITDGIVSKKSYFPPDESGRIFAVWSTAFIDNGSSGGPLVNSRGEIVGLAVMFLNFRGVVLGPTHLNIFVSGSEILRFLEN